MQQLSVYEWPCYLWPTSNRQYSFTLQATESWLRACILEQSNLGLIIINCAIGYPIDQGIWTVNWTGGVPHVQHIQIQPSLRDLSTQYTETAYPMFS